MTHYSITRTEIYPNKGMNKEACLALAKCHELRKHDNVQWYEGSDIPEYCMSVKSSKFSLCSGGHLKGDTLSEMLDDFFARVASTVFAYVTEEYEVYEMTATEFRSFLEVFSGLERESTKNGGKIKVKCRAESRKMLEWFAERV